MKAKVAFVVGVGLGYLLGTEAGRENLEKAKEWARSSWEDPKVQGAVKDAEERLTKVVREQGSQLTEKVTTAIKDATAKAGGRAGETASATREH